MQLVMKLLLEYLNNGYHIISKEAVMCLLIKGVFLVIWERDYSLYYIFTLFSNVGEKTWIEKQTLSFVHMKGCSKINLVE